MNIWGYKKQVQEIKELLKKGRNKLGPRKFNRLMSKKRSLQGKIKTLRRLKGRKPKK